MSNCYEAPESIVQAQPFLEDVPAASGGPIILPDDDFN